MTGLLLLRFDILVDANVAVTHGAHQLEHPADARCQDRGLTFSGSYRDLYPTASTLTG